MAIALTTQQSQQTTQQPNWEFRHEVLNGLALPLKQLSPKYFYDRYGSQLFDQICALKEYYPYRTELTLLPQVASDLDRFFRAQIGADLSIVEFGAGSLHKITPLLERIDSVKNFTAIDISKEHLLSACRTLQQRFCDLDITAQAQDFTCPIRLEKTHLTRMGFFPGSTIGNLHQAQALEFLHSTGQTLGSGAYLLIGVDTKKPERILHDAYNDSCGVTAKFNKNILTRINRELNGNFNLAHFAHHAFYNRQQGRIEMHLRSLRQQRVQIAEHEFYFTTGETIHTENSYKYHPCEFAKLALQAQWRTRHLWMAPDDLFAISLLQYQPSNSTKRNDH